MTSGRKVGSSHLPERECQKAKAYKKRDSFKDIHGKESIMRHTEVKEMSTIYLPIK